MSLLGVRPKLSHIIGISGLCKQAYDEEIRAFMNNHYEDDFLEVAGPLFEALEDGAEKKEELEGVYVYDLLEHVRIDSEEAFGMLPINHWKESSSYNHELTWGLIDSGMLASSSKISKIPYDDYSHVIGMDKEEMKRHIGSLQLLQEFTRYEGQWGRDYEHYRLSYFDEDLEFAFNFFHSIGIPVKKSDLDRYMIFEWA